MIAVAIPLWRAETGRLWVGDERPMWTRTEGGKSLAGALTADQATRL